MSEPHPDFLLMACDHYLSAYDKTRTGEQLVEDLDNASRAGRYSDTVPPEGMVIWEPFELYALDDVCSLISHLSVTYRQIYETGRSYPKEKTK